MSNISYTKLDETLVNQACIQDPSIPDTLNKFLDRIESLELSSQPERLEESVVYRADTFLGLTAKKQHELKAMMPFVKDLCSQNECDWIVDVGSGVGHFDKYLVANSNVSIIGIERKSDFVAGANKRQSNG